jgi:hypothetical protein
MPFPRLEQAIERIAGVFEKSADFREALSRASMQKAQFDAEGTTRK